LQSQITTASRIAPPEIAVPQIDQRHQPNASRYDEHINDRKNSCVLTPAHHALRVD
jgi:hypothetical protein